jgi:CheY-like chemotaxis protein
LPSLEKILPKPLETRSVLGVYPSIVKKVVIVEDHPETAKTISDFLRFTFPAWSVAHVISGKEALEHTAAESPDVMILDLALADEMNGLEVIRKLWEAGFHDKPKVIMVTAMGNRAFRGPRPGRPWVEQLSEHERTLVAGFFEKPYGWNAFLTAVAKAANTDPPENIKLIPENE